MDYSSSNIAWVAPYLISLLGFLVLVEQIKYLKRKSFIPGPTLVLPFIGNVVALVRNPTCFWEVQSAYASRSPLGFSANYILGRFMVFISASELSHKVFNNVRSDAFQFVGYPFSDKLFGEGNIIPMLDQEHKDLRRRVVPNFSPRALSTYTAIEQSIMLKHIISWEQLSSGLGKSKHIPLKQLIRDMNLETSSTIFTGTYLSQQGKERFRNDYKRFSLGLMKLPIDLPGFALRNARLAVERLTNKLTVCVVSSKEKILSGGEPDCMIDFWIQETVKEEAEAVKKGDPPPLHSSNQAIGTQLVNFLFAAQDGTTSSLLWAVTLLEKHPTVLDKVREEVSHIWSPTFERPITSEELQEMKYTRAVALEVLRYRPPGGVVPHIARLDFPLTKDYTIPKGTIVFPSVFDSSVQGFTEPRQFNPDRFLEGREEDQLYRRNFLVFGAGSHFCVGRNYAVNHLVLFIATFATLIDFTRHKTEDCDDIVYAPAIYPKDDCTVYLRKRGAMYPSY